MLIIWPGESHSSYSLSYLDNIFMLYRAAWHGTRIILRQVSPESISIFDFILEAYRSCDGDWSKLASQANVSQDSLTGFLEYAAVFLANIGNYYVGCVKNCSDNTVTNILLREEEIKKSSPRFQWMICRRSQQHPKLLRDCIRNSPTQS